MHAKSAVDDQNDLYRTFESIVLTMLFGMVRKLLAFPKKVSAVRYAVSFVALACFFLRLQAVYQGRR